MLEPIADLVFELQQKFEASPAPDARAAKVERELGHELERVIQGDSRLQSVDCKATMCRAVMAFASLDDDRESLGKLLAPMDGPIAQFGFTVGRETATNGAVTSTLYVKLR